MWFFSGATNDFADSDYFDADSFMALVRLLLLMKLQLSGYGHWTGAITIFIAGALHFIMGLNLYSQCQGPGWIFCLICIIQQT
jgi:hypothetical protein